jgi:NAD(P)-dependent dehydrogenase (short-subunit alcohol dehydrogenase family)
MMKPVCLVTGASGTLGRALCRELSTDYRLVASYRSNVPSISSQLQWPVDDTSDKRAFEQQDDNVYCVRADLTRQEDLRRLVEVALARFGHVDAVVNLAADVGFHGHLLESWHDDDHAPTQLLTNCIAPVHLISAVHQHCWKDQSEQNALRNRSVVNISCISGLYVFSDTSQAFYAASKAALNILTMYLSLELAPYSVRANALCPSRFSDKLPMSTIVGAIKEMLAGSTTGNVLPLTL